MFEPKYTINTEILKYIGSIEASKEVIDHAPLVPAWEKKFQEDALVRTVHHGTHIEGNELNITEAQKVLEGQEVLARSRDIQEVLNYRDVLELLEELSGKIEQGEITKEISEELIKRLHKITVNKLLPEEKIGNYRRVQVVVRNSATGEVSFTPPAFADVPALILDFLQWLNNATEEDVHPILKAGIAHYEFVRIHPFVDGNGRVARALSTLILFFEGYDIRRFFSIEEYFDTNAYDYYQALQDVARMKGDFTPWLTYFTKGLAIELTRVKEKVQKLSVDLHMKDKLGRQLMLSERQIKIIEYIQTVGYLQNKAFPQLFPMVSEDTILRELQALVTSGIIKKEGVTKGARYVLSPNG